MKQKNINKNMKKLFQNKTRPLTLKLEDCRICFVNEEEQGLLNKFTQMQRNFKVNSELNELMEYRSREEDAQDISLNDSVEDEDALRLINIICGGYVQEDFISHLSYNDFQQKKGDFDILNDIYENLQKKYKNKKIEQSNLRFRSMLLMVYLQQNIPKMSRIRVEEIFNKNRIVW